MKTETKELGMETCPGEGVVKEEKFPHSRKPLTGGSVGSFGISEGNITGRKKKIPQSMHPTTTSADKCPGACVCHQ